MTNSNSQQNAQSNGGHSSNSHSEKSRDDHGENHQSNNQPAKPEKQKPEVKSKPWGYVYIMSKRIIPLAIPIIVLISFSVILNLTLYLKGPKEREDDVLLHLELAQNSIVAENWTEAITHIENTEKAWDMIIPRIQIGVAKDDIVNLTLSLVRLKASIKSMDKPGCMRELAESFLYWDEIGK